MGTQNQRFGAVGDLTAAEKKRVILQEKTDNCKSIEERRKLGQFSTPFSLAREIVSFGLNFQNSSEISFLEPAIGTGAFYSALLSEISKTKKHLVKATGIEIDKEFFDASFSLWNESNIDLLNADFTLINSENQKYNFLISNPPYVRHHFIKQEQKNHLSSIVRNETNLELSGLAGLYCYFMLLAHKWLAPDAICGWLLPSEFMDVNYGGTIKQYLLNNVHLLKIHRYNLKDCKFDDALVSSCVVWYKNEIAPDDYEIEFSYGGTHNAPLIMKTIKKSVLAAERKWTRFPEKDVRIASSISNPVPILGDFFDVKRGLATGDNNFFILTKEQIQNIGLDMSFFKSILPSPRYLKVDEVLADTCGYPQLDIQYFLLDCSLPEDEIKSNHLYLWEYLSGAQNTTAQKYLCRSRKEWYFQEKRASTPFLCSYMGRGGSKNPLPFRFILNHSDAIATNSYLMLYPKNALAAAIRLNPQITNRVWNALKGISALDFENEGRVYGGGLKKIEPKELANVACQDLTVLCADIVPEQ